MTVLQIALLVCAVVAVWLSAIVLIVVWVMGMSRNAALDERVFTRTARSARERDGSDSSAAPDRTSA
jgi:hypothetical protein